MRDLYQRLALSPDANDHQINSALARCPNSALRQDATSVLAVAPHRETYDTLHHTLSDIGRLRARLGLTHGAHWQGDVANDFSLHCKPRTKDLAPAALKRSTSLLHIA